MEIQKKDKVFIVEQILEKEWRVNVGVKELYYLCKWRGFSSLDATFESVTQLDDCKDLIIQFERLQAEKKAKKKAKKEECFTRRGSLKYHDLPEKILFSTKRKGIELFYVKWYSPEGSKIKNNFVSYEKLVETNCTLVYNYMKNVLEEQIRKQK